MADFKHVRRGTKRKGGFPRGFVSPRRVRRKMNTEMKASKALILVRRLMTNTEKKFAFYPESVQSVDSSGVVKPLHQLAQGDQEFNRSGIKVTAKGVGFHAVIVGHASAASTIFRIMIVVDKRQIMDAAPTISAILQENKPLSYIRGTHLDRWRVLYDKMFVLDNIGNRTAIIRFWKKLNLNIHFNGTGSGDIERNGVYYVILSDQPTNTPTYTSTELITWTDS